MASRKLDDRVLAPLGYGHPRKHKKTPTPAHYAHHQIHNMSNRETSIKLALEAIENGTSGGKAAKDYNIPRFTLYNRRAGRIAARCGHANQQRLSPK